jgi:predicted ester cyclase
MSQQEQNRALVLEVYKNSDAGNFERCKALMSRDCKSQMVGNVLDRDAWAGMGDMFMRAFPDGRHVFELTEAVGDYVLLNGYFTGTHAHEFQGIPATGKVVTFSFTIIDKVEGDKVVEHRGDFDGATLIRQLSA